MVKTRPQSQVSDMGPPDSTNGMTKRTIEKLRQESDQLYQALGSLQRRLEEIEGRLKNLENENKDTQLEKGRLQNNLFKTREREAQLLNIVVTMIS